MNWGHILFGFGGRINRAKWWLTVLAIFVISVVMALIQSFVADPNATLILVALLVLWIIQLWITLAAGAKRLHDLNRSGGWLVLFIAAPILLVAVFFVYAGATGGTALLAGQTPSDTELMRIGGVAAILGLIWLALAIWALVWFGCLRGTVGPNQYGPDPLEGKL
jgi:uncharacterized membrane protein YhaH (DUF805 family)